MHVPKFDLRLRIAAALAIVCIAIVGVLGFVLYAASEEMEHALVEQLVSEEMEFLINRAQQASGTASTSGPNLQYYVVREPQDVSKLAPAVKGLGPGSHEVGSGRDEIYVSVRDLGRVRYIVVYDVGAHKMREARFKQLLQIALASAAVLAVILGYWLAGVLTRQLTELARRVGSLAPDEPHAPLARVGQDREVAALAHALDQYQARIVEMVKREQEFTANASHELRTPLTAIRTSCELLSAEPHLSDKARTRLDMISGAAEQMTERIETLLYLARASAGDAGEPVALKTTVMEAAMPCRDEIARKNLSFDVPIPEDTIVKISRRALQLVLANLIKNAVLYTDGGFVRVTYEAPRLTVSDSGRGIAPQHLPQLFERFYRGDHRADGFGLGLAIVRRICDDLGWKIEVQSQPGSGSSFTVVLSDRSATLEGSPPARQSSRVAPVAEYGAGTPA
jgi:signal transduction histidine kinase